ncbi:hypothetical protein [Photorhabdus temperata]|uniref:hypothetical protein n=1 Tax=Photorhabdus temperata TaxID=574560 RepID=UPI000401F05A
MKTRKKQQRRTAESFCDYLTYPSFSLISPDRIQNSEGKASGIDSQPSQYLSQPFPRNGKPP